MDTRPQKRSKSNKGKKNKSELDGTLQKMDFPVQNLDAYPPSFQILTREAKRRGIDLALLPIGMSKRKRNTSYFKFKDKALFWRIEWEFPNSEVAVNVIDERVRDESTLVSVLEKHFSIGKTKATSS
jgi:hypothetical protein